MKKKSDIYDPVFDLCDVVSMGRRIVHKCVRIDLALDPKQKGLSQSLKEFCKAQENMQENMAQVLLTKGKP